MKYFSGIKKQLAVFCVLALLLTAVPNFSFAVGSEESMLKLSIPDGEDLHLEFRGENDEGYHYEVVSEIPAYEPSVFTLKISDVNIGLADVIADDSSEVTFVPDETENAEPNIFYFLVQLEAGSEAKIKIIDSNGKFYLVHCKKPQGGSQGSANGIKAFLPAPGQFVNEHLTDGGWGSILNEHGIPKSMVNNIVQTGVSLGFFGGYVVLDYGKNGIKNDINNPFGVDFILYGNAFVGNSEPGCVQVSEDGKIWYDIAGSRYYDRMIRPENVEEYCSEKNFELTYINPVPSDDNESFDYGHEGTNYYIDSDNHIDVPYTGSESGSVVSNDWHNHAYFPLFANYFKAVNGNDALANTESLSFATYEHDVDSGSTLTLRGVKLNGNYGTEGHYYQYGYCDVHRNGNELGAVYNPYYATRKSKGGDPIDISWAVDDEGNPVQLNKIRYIRVYTGLAQMNGMFGEISTEVTGSSAVQAGGSGAATKSFGIEVNDGEEFYDGLEYNMSVIEVPLYSTVMVYQGSEVMLVNGVSVEEEELNMNGEYDGAYEVNTDYEGLTYQIISQEGDESPCIVVIKVVAQ